MTEYKSVPQSDELMSPYYGHKYDSFQPRSTELYQNEVESEIITPSPYNNDIVNDDNKFDIPDDPPTNQLGVENSSSTYADLDEQLYGRPRSKSTSAKLIKSRSYGRQSSWHPQPLTRFQQWITNGRTDDLERCESLVGNVFDGKLRQLSTEEIEKESSEADKFLEWITNGNDDMYKSEKLLFDEDEVVKPPEIHVEHFN